ncbi:MAG: S9 family peptidase [Gemmatimonadota bacterium]|nr:S9 family peptidase [Gemmatimonadota bacterium]
MTNKQNAPFGFWKSSFTPSTMGGQLRFSDVLWDSDGQRLVWLEGRSGRGVLVCREGTNAPYDLNDEHNVRAGVGYGGGDFTVSHGCVVYVEKSGRLFRQSLNSGPAGAITPAFGHAGSPVVSPDGEWVLYVHSYERTDVLALTNLDGVKWPVNLVSGSDFYMQPAWHPDGGRIAWIEWDQPNMPWDGTRLKLGRLSESVTGAVEETLITGNEETSVFQPEFSPDGEWLSYITTEDEWDELIIHNLKSDERVVLDKDTTLAEPAWIQGIRVYGWGPDSKEIYYQRNDQGTGTLWQVNTGTGERSKVETGPYSWLQQISVSPSDNAIVCTASSPAVPDRVITIESSGITIHRRSSSEQVSASEMSIPGPLSWEAPDGTRVYGLYYPPHNSRYSCEGAPPAMIAIHGGPTGQRTANYSGEAAFYTSRGYAFLDVNYRGSTGYGRSYMVALRGHWGAYDAEDAVGGAQALIDQGLADPDRIVIKGGSAGGYTVLNALIHHPGVFKAGLCLYGVTNLFTLATETHKFEEKYLDLMVGTLPEHGDRYQAWSPIFHADKIRDPIAVFQGTEDQVVPPGQAESIVSVLHRNGVPHIYRRYEGEGHGWRKTSTIESFYEDVDTFLKQYVLI